MFGELKLEYPKFDEPEKYTEGTKLGCQEAVPKENKEEDKEVDDTEPLSEEGLTINTSI